MAENPKNFGTFFFVEVSRTNSSKICKAVYWTNEKVHWRPRKYTACIVNKNVYRPRFSRTFGWEYSVTNLNRNTANVYGIWMAKTVYGHMLTMLHYGSTSAELEQADIQQKFSSMEFYILQANISHRGKDRERGRHCLLIRPSYFFFLLCTERSM